MKLTQKLTKGEKIEQIVIYVVLRFFAFCTVIPFILCLRTVPPELQTRRGIQLSGVFHHHFEQQSGPLLYHVEQPL